MATDKGFFHPDNIETTANLLRRMCVGTSIAEYAMLEFKDETKQDLKSRVNLALNSIKKVQDWFIHNHNASPEYKEIFRKEFLGGKLVLMGELIEIASKFDEDGMEALIAELKRHINTPEPNY